MSCTCNVVYTYCRVDELTKLIEDEVIADQQPLGAAQFLKPGDIVPENTVFKENTGLWPPYKKVIESKEMDAKITVWNYIFMKPFDQFITL